jgi:hypothetical protein
MMQNLQYNDEVDRLIEAFGETIGLPVVRWETDPVQINLHTGWRVADTIEKLGESALFASLDAQQKSLACSIRLKLKGEGRQLHQFVQDEFVWTLPQMEVIAKLHEIFDGMIAELDRRVRRLSAFFVAANDQVPIALPPQLAPRVVGIRHIPPGHDRIYFDAGHSHPSISELSDTVIDAVLDRSVRLGGVEFETVDNRMVQTQADVAWPVTDQEPFLVDLYDKLCLDAPHDPK